MMKKLMFSVLLLLVSCTNDDHFDVPAEEELPLLSPQQVVDLRGVLGKYYQNKEEIISFREDLYFEAYVVSSDEAGNWYKKMIVQDNFKDPEVGLSIRINMTSYYQFYNFGRKVLVNLNGLSIAKMNGVPTLGVANGKQVENIPQMRVSHHIRRMAEVKAIQPKPIGSHEFSEELKNLFVKLENIQFSKWLIGAEKPFTYAGEANDEFDGERMLESCGDGFSFILSTSTYADFGGFRLPSGSGALSGILTRDYYDSFYTIYLNSPADIDFSRKERCDPMTMTCGMASAPGSKILYQDDFSTQKNNKPVAGNGWTNYIQEGSRAWEAYTASGANASLGRSVRIRPAGSGDQRTVSWLITPKINFSTNNPVLNFKTSTSFANSSFLEVLVSTDWDGKDENILSSTWAILSEAYIAKKSDFFGDWLSSGFVDLSCIEGKGHIAFRYSGSDLPNYNGIYELDDVIISTH